MKKYSKQDTKPFSIAGGTNGLIFPSHPSGEQTIAYVEMDGRYPEKGVSVNDKCTETMYVLEGTMSAVVDGKTHTLSAGELIMILPGEKYSVSGSVKTLDVITPAWSSEQNRIIT